MANVPSRLDAGASHYIDKASSAKLAKAHRSRAFFIQHRASSSLPSEYGFGGLLRDGV